MARSVASEAFEAALLWIAERADSVLLLAGPPSDRVEAFCTPAEGGRMLAEAEIAPGLDGGDLRLEPGAAALEALPGARRLVVPARHGVLAVADGTADHVALASRGHRCLLILTPLAQPLPLTEGERVTIGAFTQELKVLS